MKKLKAIVVSLCLVLALGGCGKSEETHTAEELANMSEKELAEIMEQQEEEDKKDKADKKNKADEPSQEIIDAEWYSGKVQIDGVVYDLPLTVSELETLGFECYPVTYNDQFELEKCNDDYLFGERESLYVQCCLDGTPIFETMFNNSLEGFHTFADIVSEQNPTITSISASTLMQGTSSQTSEEDSIYYFPGGLQIGDSISLIEERLGTPTEIDSDMTYWYGLYNPTGTAIFSPCGLKIRVDRNTQKIIAIADSAQINPVEISTDSLETMTIDNYYCINDKSAHTLSLKMFPSAVYSDGAFQSAFLLDGQVYSFIMHSNLLNYSPDHYTTYILSETDENGVTRTLDEFYDYTISKNGYQMEGRIEIKNLSTTGAEYAYSNDTYKNVLFEIIRSIDFD